MKEEQKEQSEREQFMEEPRNEEHVDERKSKWEKGEERKVKKG